MTSEKKALAMCFVTVFFGRARFKTFTETLVNKRYLSNATLLLAN